MKAVQIFTRLFSIFLILLVFNNNIKAQDADKDQQVGAMQKKLDTKKFVFVAQSVIPQRGSLRQLTSIYDVKVSNDSLVCNLPYFGRADTAPIDPS